MQDSLRLAPEYNSRNRSRFVRYVLICVEAAAEGAEKDAEEDTEEDAEEGAVKVSCQSILQECRYSRIQCTHSLDARKSFFCAVVEPVSGMVVSDLPLSRLQAQSCNS